MSGGPLAIRPFSRPFPLRLRRAVLISGHGFQLKGGSMPTFDNRAKAFEAKFAYDAEPAFRLACRRNRPLGLWAAAQLLLTPEAAEHYPNPVVHARCDEAGEPTGIRKPGGDV